MPTMNERKMLIEHLIEILAEGTNELHIIGAQRVYHLSYVDYCWNDYFGAYSYFLVYDQLTYALYDSDY